jgi:uncharacterized FlgJ-related protein
MTLNLQQKNCGKINTFTAKPMFGVNILAVFTLALVSLVLTLNYFYSISKMYKNIRQKYIQNEEQLRNKAEEKMLSLRKIKTKNERFISKMSEVIKKQDIFGELTKD